MDLKKGGNKKDSRCDVKIPKALHDKIKHLAYVKKTSNKDIIAKAIALYEKSTLFDDLF
jgi:predicted transcriptional regulator